MKSQPAGGDYRGLGRQPLKPHREELLQDLKSILLKATKSSFGWRVCVGASFMHFFLLIMILKMTKNSLNSEFSVSLIFTHSFQ